MRATTTRRQENQTEAPPLGLPINAAAIRAGLGVWTIRAAINSRALIAKKAGRRTLILESDLRAWLDALPTYSVGGSK
jgi:hypothetical protein